ncbi:hypothetical protein FC34_GL001117 [Lacticaseibacillus brantae DSM 23927]|uniref:DNA polymerase III polC-type n=1 Tax=Lacticaseibacillus brantae DSM 23927 TaxID=1423727 RepID=A0A0R2AZB8_9LACO|nr:hypothetical protein FC34_GL001117 [Lacticaseibacillus brantae DSM 23927]
MTKFPKSLRGDLTKWYQEIQTGVYVGNVSARIREQLWERITQNIGSGEATMVYNAKNELGYQFRTTRRDRAVIDLDGVPFLQHLATAPDVRELGFSDMAKFHKAKKMAQRNQSRRATSVATPNLVAIDVETTGLNSESDALLSIGAVKTNGEEFYRLIKVEVDIPPKIQELTGISTQLLDDLGVPLATALEELLTFAGQKNLIGYNAKFDEGFLLAAMEKVGIDATDFAIRDLIPAVKKHSRFLPNYRLETVLKEFDVENQNPHNALADAKATLALGTKLIKTGTFRF